ncbi:MAG: HAMP domain-containing protein [Deltaproteobacteria bacterium]|nr:HAMP domain-containing protein [Deltaproteobacteria bacterium]MCB9785394.1 HAMP domain-containing protein [Deltaproteobacteria bacterium]
MTAQVVGVCALVGWLSFRNGEAAVRELSNRYIHELTLRIYERLHSYVSAPVRVIEADAHAMRSGRLDLEDLDALAQHFWLQMRTDPTLGYLSFGRDDGAFIGVQRVAGGRLVLETADGGPGSAMRSYALDEAGRRGALIRSTPGYDPRKRPWYVAATRADRATWSDLYASFSAPDTTFITAVVRISDPYGRVRGVLGADLIVSQLNAYLRALTRHHPADVVIIDSERRLVATSVETPTVRVGPDGALQRIAAGEVEDARLRGALSTLEALQASSGERVDDMQGTLETDDRALVVELSALRDARALDWSIVALVPESAFMAHIDQTTRITLVLCLGAVLLGILVAFFVSRRIAAPLRALARKARRIHEGDLDVTFEPDTEDEIGELNATMAEMVVGMRDRDFIRAAFGRYVSPELVDRFIADPSSLALGGQLVRVTLLMSDLRGFTRLSEQLAPQAMVRLLNDYLGAMTEVIREHRGTIIEFIGDAILVVFGAPLRAEDDAVRAVRCAVSMELRLRELNAMSAEQGRPELSMGIGLHTGDVVAGNIGSAQQAKYGVVGEAVNLTARIESLTLGTQIIMSEDLRRVVGDAVVTGAHRVVRVKGISQAQSIWNVRGVAGDPPLDLGAPPELEPVPAELAIDVHRLDRHIVLEQPVRGRVTALVLGGLLVELPERLDLLSRVELRMELTPGRRTQGAYGSVQDCVASRDAGRFRIHIAFTTLEDADREAIDALRQRPRRAR